MWEKVRTICAVIQVFIGLTALILFAVANHLIK